MSTLVVPAGGSIQAAIDAAAPGDTVDVAAGDYLDQFLTTIRDNPSPYRRWAVMVVLIATDTQPPNGKAYDHRGRSQG